MKRSLSFAIAALLMFTVLFTACGGGDDKTLETTLTSDTAAETLPEEIITGREGAKDNIPDGLNFDGQVVNVVYRNEDWYRQWDVEGENTGDLIQDAIWERNNKVEERFGVDLNLQPTRTTGLGNVASELKTMVLAGSDEYDLIVSTANTTITQSLYPYLYEMSDMPHLDITQPWWRTSAINELSFDGEHYRYLMGDNTLNDYFKCGVVFANKAIYESVHGDPDDMYRAVLDGGWTYDRLMELTTPVYSDINGDGIADAGDRYGLMVPNGYNETTVHMMFGCDIVTYARTDDGGIDLSVFNNEKNVRVVDKLIEVLHKTDGVWQSDKSIDNSTEHFAADKSLFWTGRLSNVVQNVMREMTSDYAILPMPKFDAAQENYVTYIHDSATITCAPITLAAGRADMIGAVLEGWASEAYRTVITGFIETAMKVKYSRDELSGQVIDIIFDDPMVGFVSMFGANMKNLFNTCTLNGIASGQNNFASGIASTLDAAQTSIDQYLADIAAAN